MTRLILIRHGQTDYCLENRYCGFSDPPLNKKGIWQSEKLFHRLSIVRVDKVYSSDLQRALQTARIIFKDIPIEQTSGFREMNFGVFEGLRYEEIIKIHPRLYRDWIKNPDQIKLSDGEGLPELNKRVISRLSFILSENEGSTIALVTHSGPIRVILCKVLGYDLERFWQIEQETGALNIIDYSEGLTPTTVKINDTSHLSG